MNRLIKIGEKTYLEKSNYCRHGFYIPMCMICSEDHRRFEEEMNRIINGENKRREGDHD